MEVTGFTSRRLDDLGRIIIPKSLCLAAGWNIGDQIDIILQKDGTMLIKKSEGQDVQM